MNDAHEMPGIDPRIDANAVSVYGQDTALDDFPVLKAFQQYVDAEQAKAHKRMMSLSIFFIFLMVGVVTVFVLLLLNISKRNQELNDRLIDYAMSNRAQNAPTSAPVVVQPPQDSAAILALTAKMDEMQKKLAEDQVKAEKAAKEAAEKAAEEARRAAIEAAKPKEPTPEELEIKRLKALLLAEKEKKELEEEKKIKREKELEAYRRKYYPELYEETPTVRPSRKPVRKSKPIVEDEDDDLAEIDDILLEAKAGSHDEVDEVEDIRKPAPQPLPAKPQPKVTQAPSPTPVAVPSPSPAPKPEQKKEYSIPVDIKGSSIPWNVPND